MLSACPLLVGMPPEEDDARNAGQDRQCEGRNGTARGPAAAPPAESFRRRYRPSARSADPLTTSEVISQSVSRGVAGGGLFLEALQDDRLEVAGNLWNQPPRRYGGVIADLVERVEDSRSLVRRASG